MTETFTVQTDSVDQTRTLACALAEHLTLPVVFAISGQLGAGKTHFIKGLGQGIGLDPKKICSATFVLIAEYGREKRLVHIDAYRLDRHEDLENIGWYELLEDQNAILAIEWAEKIAPILPTNRINLHIDIINDHRRKLTFSTDSPACAQTLRHVLSTTEK